jgi:peptidyl-prolyl cis-trans isomerase C
MRGSFERRGRCALVALGLSVFLLPVSCKRAPPPPPPPPPSVATVDGVPIPLARLQLEIDRLRKGSVELPANVDPQDVPKLGRALLDGLIDRQLVLARAKATGIAVSDAELQKASESLPGVDADEMRDRLLAEKYIASETRREAASPAEARAYYDTHRKQLEEPEAVHCLQIATRSPDEAKSALDQLRRGASFAEVAQKVSVSPDAQKGGDLGWFAKGTMPKAFDDTCFSLGAGKMSGVVQSPYGFHVFKLLARRPAKQKKFEDVRADAELKATADKRADAQRALLAQLREHAQIKIDESSLALLK